MAFDTRILLERVLVATCLIGLASTGCTRMARLPTLASDSGGSNSDSGGSGDSSNSGGSGDSNTGSGSGGGNDGAVTATVTIAAAVGILGLAYLASLSMAPRAAGPAGLDSAQRDDAIDESRRWLAQHRRQVRADIARGAGPFVDELAAVHTLPIELRPTLGAALQRAQGELDAPLAGGPPSADEAVRFAEALGRALDAEPSLAPHLGPVAAAR